MGEFVIHYSGAGITEELKKEMFDLIKKHTKPIKKHTFNKKEILNNE